MKCPDCKGDGKILGVFPIYHSAVHQSKRKPMVEMVCGRCGGKGQMPDFMAGWLDRGQAMKSVRVAEGRTLRQEAERLGIDPIQLSQMERGFFAN